MCRVSSSWTVWGEEGGLLSVRENGVCWVPNGMILSSVREGGVPVKEGGGVLPLLCHE